MNEIIKSVNPDIDVIKQTSFGVIIENHYGSGITVGGEIYNDLIFYFTQLAIELRPHIGLTHLIDFEQTNEIQ